MQLVGLFVLLLGVGALGGVAALISWLHRRFDLPYALLTVGVMTGIGAWLVQVVVIGVLDRALVEILPVGALAMGLTIGFSDEIARLLGFQYLARSTVTRSQAAMIGAGHGLPWATYTGLLVIGVGLSMLGGGGDEPDSLGAILAEAVAGSLNGLLPLVMHMALSWVVLQVFLRGEIGWLFAAIFSRTVNEIMARLLGAPEDWSVAAWRAVVAVICLLVLLRLNPPPADAA